MKVFFDNVNWRSSSGPNTFASRLATQLSLDGHVIADPTDYDVSLSFIEEFKTNISKPRVLRLDGIWFKPDEFASGKNALIERAYRSVDHVVWQSDFDRQMTTKWWGEPKDGSVIKNGIKLQQVEKTNATLHELRERYEKVFVCSANWHRQKRLKECYELFSHLRKSFYPYSCLVVMGANPDFTVSDRNVYYTGSLPHETCLEVFRHADWCVHLAWADHSPNVVCEALSQGCPVICAETGGTKELIGENGLVLKDAESYNFELYDYDNPPSLDVTQVSAPLPTLEVNPSVVDIKNVARRYEGVFESLLTS